MPQWLRGCTRLQLLDLSWNRLGGTIPSWIGDFQSLFYLDLQMNSFVGEIPKEITGLPALIHRNMSIMEPSDFPFFWKKNKTSGVLQYAQFTSFPSTVDLGGNSLNGSIWPEFGNLKDVRIFVLSNNFLSGSIPDNLSEMTDLETLNLSYNNLSGSIPSSLARLNFLSRFSVAYNNLSGPVPRGGQFSTFPNSSFEGNNLCRDHAPPCPTSQSQPSLTNHGDDNYGSVHYAMSDINLGMTIGLAFGMAIGIALGTTRIGDSCLHVIIRFCDRVKLCC